MPTRSSHPKSAVPPSKAASRPERSSQRQLGLLAASRNLSQLQTHDLVTVGLPVSAARELMSSFQLIDSDTVLKTLGVSERTLQRGEASGKLLDANTSDRALRLASIAAMATDVLGTREAAEQWLTSPAIGLDRRKPIDLLQSTDGTDLVRTLLIRMDYGVYA